jgi:hypothetical protein
MLAANECVVSSPATLRSERFNATAARFFVMIHSLVASLQRLLRDPSLG